MPYIKPDDREYVEEFGARCAGDLNYLFTKIADDYLAAHGLNYQHVNDVIGALEGAKLELYRRVAAPYEDLKIEENGDVYTCLDK